MGVFSFNADFYLNAFPDVKSAVESGQFESAEQHYRLFGAFELCSPNEFVDPVFYLDSNPDVKEAYLNNLIADPLEHYRTNGFQEGRIPGDGFVGINEFDFKTYLDSNPDLAASGITDSASAFNHYLNFGIDEDRSGVQTISGTEMIAGRSDASADTETTADLAGSTSSSGGSSGRQGEKYISEDDFPVNFVSPQLVRESVEGNKIYNDDVVVVRNEVGREIELRVEFNETYFSFSNEDTGVDSLSYRTIFKGEFNCNRDALGGAEIHSFMQIAGDPRDTDEGGFFGLYGVYTDTIGLETLFNDPFDRDALIDNLKILLVYGGEFGEYNEDLDPTGGGDPASISAELSSFADITSIYAPDVVFSDNWWTIPVDLIDFLA